MLAQTFLDALASIQPYNHEKFANRLYNKSRQCQNVSFLRDYLPERPRDPVFDNDLESPTLNGVNVLNHLELLAEQAAVKGLAELDSTADKHNLKNCISSNKAEEAAQKVFNETSTSLYAEYLDRHLSSYNVPSLTTLANDQNFKDELSARLNGKHFAKGALRNDQIIGNGHTYTTALLFAYDYLHYGPGFKPHLDETIPTAKSGELLKTWFHDLWDDSDVERTLVASLVTYSSPVVHAYTSDGLIMPHTFDGVLDTLTRLNVVPDVIRQASEASRGSWQSLMNLTKNAWDSVISHNWRNAVVQAASYETSSTRETNSNWDDFGSGFITGLTVGMVGLKHNWERSTVRGQAVADWINAGRQGKFSGLFTQDAPSVVTKDNYTTEDDTWGSSCFIKGTKIAIEQGEISIECVHEGAKVLTNAATGSFGIASDEDVITPATMPFVCGFNNETPFFSPGHVFHTTTGMKAVDPYAAQRENEWLEVGQLRPGHVLYRMTTDGKDYEQVTVESIQVEEMKDSSVHMYGVHLREGARSYHANGYLVAVNYPEITIKSIAKQLSRFPRKQRTQMLYHIKALEPLFQRFGATTISDVLAREIKGVKRRGVATIARPMRKTNSQLRKATRSFMLYEISNKNLEDYKLPVLTIHEGVVAFNGEAEHRALIDKNDRTIRWTRSVGDLGFEHGYVEMYDHGLAGRGTIVVHNDKNLSDIGNSASDKSVSFAVAKPSVHVEVPSRSLKSRTELLKSLPIKASALHTNITSASRMSAMALNVAGVTSNAPLSAIPLVGGPTENGLLDGDDSWDLMLDRSVWGPDEVKTTAADPVNFGQFIFSTYHTDGVTGLPLPIIVVPALDQVLEEINAAHVAAGEEKLGPLYESVVEIASDGSQLGTVMMSYGDLLMGLADKPADGSNMSMLDVKFSQKVPGSTTVLPILFQTATLKLAPDFSTATGAVMEYNPENRGNEGSRHFIVSSDSASASSLNSFATTRVMSTSLATARAAPVTLTRTEDASPASVTRALAMATPLTIAALQACEGYNSATVHTTSQALLQDTMLYHMAGDDRAKFLKFEKPEKLPPDLAENLPSSLKEWLKNTYAPAYISFMIAQTRPSKDINWRQPLTDADKDKIWYWWSGAGDKCLAKSKEYNQLNQVGSVAAIRQLYSKTLQPYLDAGGKEWAEKFIKSLTNKHALLGLLRQPISAGENVLNKYCNILTALDPAGDYGEQLFNAILTFAKSLQDQSSYISLGGDAAKASDKKWIDDAMHTLVVAILSNDKTGNLNKTVSKDLMDSLDKLLTEYNIDKSKDAVFVADELVIKMAELTSAVVLQMGTIGLALKGFAGCSGFKKATAVVNNAIDWVGKKTPGSMAGKAALVKGLFVLAVSAVYSIAAWSTLKKWDDLTGPQRAIAILSVLAFTVDVIAKLPGAWKAVKQWKEGWTILPENQIVGATKFDQGISNALNSEKGIASGIQIEKDVTNMTPRESYQAQLDLQSQTKSANIGDSDPSKMKQGEKLETELKEIENGSAKKPPGVANGGWKRFSTGERVLRGVNIAIGIAFTIAMSIDLAQNWDHYNDTGKALNVLQIVIQGLCVLCDAAILAADLAIGTAFAVSESVLFALPIIGAVLAVVGIVVMVLLMKLNILKPEEPPLNDVEIFLKDTAHPLIDKMDSPPNLSLSYSATSDLSHDSSALFTVTAMNSSGNEVSIEKATISLEVGDDDACLFKSPATFTGVDDPANPSPMADGTVGVAPKDLTTGRLVPNGVTEKIKNYDYTVAGAIVAGTASQSGPLKLGSQQSCSVSWHGVINKAGSTYLQIVESLASGDKCRKVIEVKRV